LIRTSIQKVASGRAPVELPISQDDMSLPDGGNNSTTSSLESRETMFSSGKRKGLLQRSNSSPELLNTFTSSLKSTEEMDTSDIG
jgi:hypothetical protein